MNRRRHAAAAAEGNGSQSLAPDLGLLDPGSDPGSQAGNQTLPAREQAAPYGAETTARRFPTTLEFSPAVIDLRQILQIAEKHSGNKATMKEAIRSAFFSNAATSRSDPAERLAQQSVRAYNAMLGMRAYGLLEGSTFKLSDLAAALLALDDDEDMHRVFAEHILRKVAGIEVLEGIRTLQRRSEKVTKETLASELERGGFEMTRGPANHLRLLLWLRRAGVLDAKGYAINELVAAKLSGVSPAELESWAAMGPAPQAFMRTLRRVAEGHGGGQIDTRSILDQAEIEHGVRYGDDVAANVLRPLEASGWIELEARPSTGRGGKSGRVSATKKLLDVDLDVLLGFPTPTIPPDLRALLDRPLADIRADLKADTHTKGIALELLVLRMIADLGLSFVGFRVRTSETGGAEVDVIAEGVHLHFSRWLFQCKNVTGSVGLSALAKEVGMATLLRGHVVVMVTTSTFKSTVITYANQLAATSALQVILLDRSALDAYWRGAGPALAKLLHDRAGDILRLKRPQVTAVISELQEGSTGG